MAFIDELQFKAVAGKGGDGVVRWRHEKFIAKGGPNGGNGGRGGDVVIRAIRNVHVLSQYKNQKGFFAEHGGDGAGGSRQGKYGDELFIDLPVGSIVTNIESGQVFRLEKEAETHVILKGGKGGYGNEHFKSSVNTTPEKATTGEPGEQGIFQVVVEMFADVGLIGLPNAGKSSLLNILTNAQAKVGNYAFTTLDPNLGDFYGYTIADIPGLIEGASSGKGLGHKFLKHIKRTKMLVHLISAENGQESYKIYEDIRNELANFDKNLLDKKELIVISKIDTVSEEDLNAIKKQFSGKDFVLLSLYDDTLIQDFKKHLSQILKNYFF